MFSAKDLCSREDQNAQVSRLHSNDNNNAAIKKITYIAEFTDQQNVLLGKLKKRLFAKTLGIRECNDTSKFL